MSRLKGNKGNAVTILGLFMLLAILFTGIFIVDMGKAMYMKSLYHSYARKAVQTAIKEQDSIGGLKPEAADRVVTEYYLQKTPNGVRNTNESAYNSACDKLGEYPKISIEFDNKREKDSGGTEYTSVNYKQPYIPDRHSFFMNQYNGIQVRIEDVTDNYFFGIFGVPCAKIHIGASGITTTSFDEDALEINK